MNGRVCIVTGATSGIGRAAACELARRGATVAVHGRSPEKCELTVAQIKAATGNDRVDAIVAELQSQDQVRALAAALLERYPEIHVLLNNAGVFNTSFSETPDGIETTLAVNHLAGFLLTNLLLDRLEASGPARIVCVSSEVHRFAKLDFDDLEFRRRKFRGMQVYGVSKLLNLLFTNELADRLHDTDVTVNALHPGVVNTGLGDNNPPTLLMRAMRLCKFAMRTPEKGAETAVFLASSPDVAGMTGTYWIDCRKKRAREISHDRDARRRLWEISEKMTGLSP